MSKKMCSKDYDTRTIFLVARNFITTPNASFEDIGVCCNMSNRMVSKLLYRGIAENIYSSTLAEAIYAKIMRVNKRGYRHSYSKWDKAFDERLEKRKEVFKKIQNLTNKKNQFDFVINTYEEYVVKVEAPLDFDVLIEKRTKIESYIESLRLSLS